MALASTTQADFSVGTYRGRKAPETAVYDAINALVNDEGLLYKRGGSAFYSASNAGSNLLSVYDTFLQAGQRTVAFGAAAMYALNGTTPVTVFSSGGISVPTSGRAVGVGGVLVIPTPSGLGLYGGSLKTSGYATGTVTVTAASKTMTGVGTSWLANVDAGEIFHIASASESAVIASVDSDTQITFRNPWPFATAAGASYFLQPVQAPVFNFSSDPHLAAVGSSPRLIVTAGNKMYFTERGPQFAIDTATNYIELPTSAIITGAAPMGSGCVLFTSEGVWAVSNMDLDPVDAYGNIQWAQERVNGNLLLWGDAGIAAYDGSLIVPGIDDVYAFSLGAPPNPLTGSRGGQADAGIRDLYRSYVKAGYQPGLAAVYRGHYVLPVINGSTLVDVLVCRLDRGAAWTRWTGHAAGFAYAIRTGSASRSPQLLGVASQRITDLSGCFVPVAGNALEADGTTPDLVVTTRDFDTGQQPGLVKKARLRYELTDDGSGGTAAPTVTLAFTSDQDGGTFATLTEKGLQGGGTGGAVSDGSKYGWWLVAKKRERLRFRVTVTGASASFVLRSIELLMRASGKQ